MEKKEKNKIVKKEKVREVIVETKSGFNTAEVIVIVVISILFGLVIGFMITNSKKSGVEVTMSRELQSFITTYNDIKDNYYNKVDEKDLVNSAIKGMVDSLDDPHSVYMNDSETDEFNEKVEGYYVGIGATVESRDGNNYIVGIFDKSPAKKSGLKPGDMFIKVDDKDVRGMDVTDLTNLIKGKENTKVTITVLRGEEEITKKVTRSSIEIQSISGKVFEQNDKKVGYISINAFASNTYSQFKKELAKLEKQKIDSLIIDVRYNLGGHLDQVTKILNMFMNENKVLYQVEHKGERIKEYSKTKESRKYKVAVLINSASASASEILAAAFKESYNKALVVGTKSYGKGTVQKVYQLPNGASFKYTTEKWLTPKGNWIDNKGIEPTNVVEISNEYREDPKEENDNQLHSAIELLTK